MPRHEVAILSANVLHGHSDERLRVSYEEAERMEEEGHVLLYCRRCGKTVNRGRCLGARLHDMVYRLRHFERLKKETPPAISASQMQANAGIPPKYMAEKAGEVFIEKVRERVANWNKVGTQRRRCVFATV